jgi:putative transposase
MKSERIRHKKHHLSRDCYLGQVSVAMTACIEAGRPIFRNSEIVAAFTEILREAAERNDCVVPVYCFMPEHLHTIITGQTDGADTWKAICRFKQRTGYWLSQNSSVIWQSDFYDHIIRRDESFANQIRYIVNNPVRRGLVENWEDYPFTGSIGFNLERTS